MSGHPTPPRAWYSADSDRHSLDLSATARALLLYVICNIKILASCRQPGQNAAGPILLWVVRYPYVLVKRTGITMRNLCPTASYRRFPISDSSTVLCKYSGVWMSRFMFVVPACTNHEDARLGHCPSFHRLGNRNLRIAHPAPMRAKRTKRITMPLRI